MRIRAVLSLATPAITMALVALASCLLETKPSPTPPANDNSAVEKTPAPRPPPVTTTTMLAFDHAAAPSDADD